MAGSYRWTEPSIFHPVGCQCSFDENYVPCGCFGTGTWVSGPLNPTQYAQEFAAAEAEAQRIAAEQKAQKEAAQKDAQERARNWHP